MSWIPPQKTQKQTKKKTNQLKQNICQFLFASYKVCLYTECFMKMHEI